MRRHCGGPEGGGEDFGDRGPERAGGEQGRRRAGDEGADDVLVADCGAGGAPVGIGPQVEAAGEPVAARRRRGRRPRGRATRELEEEELERDDLAAVAKTIEQQEPISRWWWLLPPEQLAAFESFRDKADAWVFVAGGAFLIAIGETWGLHEEEEWSELVFWALIVVMSAICIANALRRMHRRQAGPLGKRD